MKPVIYTVGHSVHKADYFPEQIKSDRCKKCCREQV